MLPPSKIERSLVAKCLLTEGVLIGNEDEIWTSSLAERALRTLRLCVDAIALLIKEKQGVYPASVKSTVMWSLGQDVVNDHPFALDEMADFIMKDGEARAYWDGTVLDDRFPHRCPICAVSAAFIGYSTVECKLECCDRTRRRQYA